MCGLVLIIAPHMKHIHFFFKVNIQMQRRYTPFILRWSLTFVCVLLVQVERGTCAHAQKLVSAVSILLSCGVEQYMALQVWGSVGSTLVCT